MVHYHSFDSDSAIVEWMLNSTSQKTVPCVLTAQLFGKHVTRTERLEQR